jgi:HEPN domain-containing protein
MSTYTIQDWLNGLRASTDYAGQKRFQDESIVFMRFSTQLDILRSANRRFESSLLDIRQLVQADLMDSELETARELLKRGFHRAAGAMAGVVLEKHLQQVVSNHAVTIRKKSPGIADLNEVLKGAGVLDVPTWRFVQRLGDLRNICSHGKDREPTSGEVEELVAGVEKITKTVF